MLGILVLRSIEYYKIKPGVLHICSKYFRFESADVPHNQFNKFVNTMKQERGKRRNK